MSETNRGVPALRVIYLHGFRSSPASFKARLIGEALAQAQCGREFLCPQLPDSPQDAWHLIRNQLQPTPQDLVVGSSLGGFYAHAIAEATGCRAALLNPAMDAPRLLADRIGTHTRWHDETAHFEFGARDIEALRAIQPDTLTRPERYLLMAATGDEVIDWRTMVAALPGVRAIVIEGSDHALSDFARHLPMLLEFAGISSPSDPDLYLKTSKDPTCD